jgi:hypothetical protein
MKNYKERKEAIRNEAIEFQYSFSEGEQYSYKALADIQGYFEKQGKKYGLLKEFRENGII